MPAVARKSGEDTIACTDGAQGSLCGTRPTRFNWNTATVQLTDEGSDDVFVNDVGVVRQDDKMVNHANGVPCTTSAINHTPALSTYSSNVYVNGKLIGRLGDKYNSDGNMDHTISSASPDVFANS
jgi:uncharacterized Zn-binding protein involved in type VI secretion